MDEQTNPAVTGDDQAAAPAMPAAEPVAAPTEGEAAA